MPIWWKYSGWQLVAEDSSTVGHVKVQYWAFETRYFRGATINVSIERKGDGDDGDYDDDDEESPLVFEIERRQT